MRPASPTDLSVSGELSATYAGVETRIEAAGSSLRWHLGDARAVIGGLPSPDRAGVGVIARRLSAAGLTLRVVDDRGPIAELGAIRRSPVGWALFGTARVRPRRLWRWPGFARRR